MTLPKAWRVAVIGSQGYPDANRRIYARLKLLRDDWPRATFHIITATTGTVASAALRAAKKLGMSYSALADGPVTEAERVLTYWDFVCLDTARQVRIALELGIHTEIWNAENEPDGPRGAEKCMGME